MKKLLLSLFALMLVNTPALAERDYHHDRHERRNHYEHHHDKHRDEHEHRRWRDSRRDYYWNMPAFPSPRYDYWGMPLVKPPSYNYHNSYTVSVTSCYRDIRNAFGYPVRIVGDSEGLIFDGGRVYSYRCDRRRISIRER